MNTQRSQFYTHLLKNTYRKLSKQGYKVSFIGDDEAYLVVANQQQSICRFLIGNDFYDGGRYKNQLGLISMIDNSSLTFNVLENSDSSFSLQINNYTFCENQAEKVISSFVKEQAGKTTENNNMENQFLAAYAY